MSETLFFPVLTGGILLLAGCIQYFFPPKKINGLYGYRTANSMKSERHWKMAQVFSAKQLILLGTILLLLSPIGYFLTLKEEQLVFFFMTTMIIGVVVMLIRTERFLKKIPDEEN
jgi:uncharacterized membrane protein